MHNDLPGRTTELAHLDLLAQVDSLVAELKLWADRTPDWPPARQCRALIHRLAERADSLRLRLDAPLVVAMFGGTGTGKSALANALVGATVTQAGRERPTTRRPTLICRADLGPELLGIDPDSVQVVRRDLAALRDLVLIDCPDPDTTEDTAAADTNLARLRDLLPHCDVLLVTTTQQKYRSARVWEELATAATGARLVFVQTHADQDEDIREDWARMLAEEYTAAEIFFVDSLSALEDARQGIQPRGDFARLVELLTRELAGAAGNRVRRANFLDLAQQAIEICRSRIDGSMGAVEQLEAGVLEQRGRLAARLASQMREELLGSRRPWENRLVGEVASRWGFSPFACVLRLYQGLGALLSSAALLRARTPAQLALWGVWESGRRWRSRARGMQADAGASRAIAFSWDESELRTAAIIVDGYAADAGLSRDESQLSVVARQAADAGAAFVSEASTQLRSLIRRLAERRLGWGTRLFYELAFTTMLGLLLVRFGKNFFYDSWLAADWGLSPGPPQPLLGVDFFIGAAFVLLLWSAILLWLFTARLRRGLKAEVNELAERWTSPTVAAGLFAGLENQCRRIRAYRQDLARLENRVRTLQEELTRPEPRLGRRVR